MTIQVVVVGARGKKLGYSVCQAILGSDNEFKLAAAVERPDAVEARRDDKEFGGALVSGSLSAAMDARVMAARNIHPKYLLKTVVFYATKADALLGRLQEADDLGYNTHVIGTTGLDQAALQAIKELAESGNRIVLAPNFSLGAWLGADQCANLATQLPNADVEIIETHHNLKEDAPSGTALLWARAVVAARGQEFGKVVIYGRHGMSKRVPGEVCIHSVRGGNVPGNHRAIFFNQGDETPVEHNVRSGVVFAEGALTAIRWAAQGDKPGLYGMPDVLGLDFLKVLGVS